MLELQPLRAGDLVGEEAAVLGLDYEYAVVAAVTATALVIDTSIFLRSACPASEAMVD